MFRVLALLCSLLFGATASQLPEFAQQYRQRLGGALDELNRFVDRFDSDARAEGLNRDEALARYRIASDPFLERRGRTMYETISRRERLQQQLAELNESGSFTRLAPVVAQIDGDVARRTISNFEPGIPITQEGIGLGVLGLLFGRLIAPIFGLSHSRRRRFA